ncbi:MAG: InlB B-repeat-containing protein, partial [Prevotellaceae bacterium]|nr:InlB B-repeat-containing protein [Prevotellaceae bacterium]
MKTKAVIFSMLGLLLCGLGAFSQSVNQLSIPLTDGRLGQEVLVPVYMTNEAEITGIQVNIHFPEGAQVNTQGAALTGRSDSHTIVVHSEGNNNFLFIIFSASNKLIKGNSGILFNIPVTLPLSWREDASYPFTFNQVILSTVNGDNLATASDPGAIKVVVEPRPDFTVNSITVSTGSVAPGGKFIASWTVKNTGEAATASGWNERIVLEDENGRQTFLGTLYQEGIIDAGGSVNRQAEFSISQLPGIEGNVKLSVQIIPDAGSGELPGAQGNNTAKSELFFTITKKLLLEAPAYALPEKSSTLVQCKLSRSGNWSQQQVFALSTGDSLRLSVPASVTIPANQSGAYFYIKVIDNLILDEDSLVVIRAEGSGYDRVTKQIVIEDANLPSLSLAVSKTEITQGETFTLTIERERVASSDLPVSLTCNLSKRFDFPSPVTIPAGQKSITVDVIAIDDKLPDITRSAEFTASAAKHIASKASVTLYNNNLPEIELALSPGTVGKSDGLLAIKAVLRRLTYKNDQITVELSDNSGGRLYYANKRITLQPGVEEVQFTIGVIDNDLVDGDRTVDVTAAVYVSSCGCAVAGTGAGIVEASITILDTNSPALKVSSSQPVLPEGKTDAAILTITQNTPPTEDIEVTLSSDHDSELDYEKTVTIPAGSLSVQVPVSALPNTTGVSKGDRTVVFTVIADGYKKGTCWAMISDQTLPDAVISEIALIDAEPEAEGKTDIRLVISNTGAASLPADLPVNIYLSNSTNALKSFYTTKVLGIGESETIVQTVDFPNATGSYTLHAVVNENQSAKELLYLNNTSEKIPVTLLPKFSAETTTDKKIYRQGEAVVISGQLTGNEIANAAVEVYLICSEVRQTLDAVTDASGRFQITYQPSVFQSGHFIIGACYPKEGLTVEQASFDIYGIKREGSGYITHDLLISEPYQGTIKLTNTGTLALTNVRTEIVSSVDNATVVFDTVSSIAGNATAVINYTLTGTTPSEGDDWQPIRIRVLSNESDLLDLTLYAYFRTPKGKLQTDISSIRTTMTKGTSRDYPFTITNTGKGESGKISLSLPANGRWLSMATPQEMASLEYNESATVILRFTPTDDLPLNVPVTGTIGVNCENGSGFSLPFTVEPVSESTGTLVVDVCDEFTYYTAEAPHLAGAKVSLKHPVTNALIAEGLTDSEGLFTVENLPEGYYALEVSADKHDKYRNNILVDPGKETRKVINLSFQAITYSWEVEETGVEDKYEIITTVKYETNVPVPVVEVVFPEFLEFKDQIFPIYATNKGLISAQNVTVNLPELDEITFELLSQNSLPSLAPQQSIVFYVKMTIKEQPQLRMAGPHHIIGCIAGAIGLYYTWYCGLEDKLGSAMANYTWGECSSIVPWFSGGGGGCSGCGSGPGKPGKPGHPNDGDYVPTLNNDYPTIVRNCDDCANEFALKFADCGFALLGCVGGVPGYAIACAWGVGRCSHGAISGNNTMRQNIWCGITSIGGCIPGPIGCGISIGSCLVGLLDPCGNMLRSSGLAGGGIASYPPYILSFQEKMRFAYDQYIEIEKMSKEFFGDEIWFESDENELNLFYSRFLELNPLEKSFASDDLLPYKPSNISDEILDKFVEYWNNTRLIINGENVDGEYLDIDKIEKLMISIESYEKKAIEYGYESMSELVQKEMEAMSKKLQEPSSSVCSSITLQFSQTMTMTRQAFRGTLTVFNGHESIPMEDVKLNLVVKDEFGNVATSHEFQINNESLKDFGGELNGYWSLDAQQTGVATIVFIPTKYAAPVEPVDYSFGGTLSYLDPFTGLTVTRDLFPATMTVKPSPNLDLTYFMQRDVLGDDPLTPEVESIIPAEFSLLIRNVGEGEATDVRMVTQQPKIVDNQKGLLIDFELLNSQLKGGDYTLALGSNVATGFGNIPAGKTTYAQWWFTGSLLGHFTGYDVQATHMTSYGNPDLTLLNEVTIHELIRSIRTPDGQGSFLTGFVVNDIADAEDLPDMIYLTDGAIEPVAVTTDIQCAPAGSNQYQLTVTPAEAGWNYGKINDPTAGNQELLEIKRFSDNTIIDLRNFWQTDRTLHDGKDPLYENKLHLVDKLGTETEQYLLTFSPRPDIFLAVEAFEGTPDTLVKAQVMEITVRFNKDIIPSTFTSDAIRLNCQGVGVDASLINITQVNGRTFKLDLSAVTEADGYYVLTVQTAAVTDYEGYQGKTGKTADWNQYMGGQVQFNLMIEPENGGAVTPLPGKYDYAEVLNLQATPDKGYEFEKWSLNGETLSTEPSYNFTLISSKAITASFKLKLYDVAVNYDSKCGTVTGGGTGKYSHGSKLVLRAEPLAGYVFTGWKIDGVFNTDFHLLDIQAEAHVTIEALFSAINTCTSINTPIDARICAGETYEFSGKSLTASGIYYDTLTTVQGCDSIVELSL